MDWRLLKEVSRSFYLTLCLLPVGVRESIALAYLLARLSDTKADGAESPGERELLEREEEMLRVLRVSPDREEIERVWQTIQEGQDFDQRRFHRGPGQISPALSEEERDRYTYLVAGCVGEFWTRICAKRLRGFAVLSEKEMTRLGVNFGKGLQLINILRDRQGDRARGRIYVADEQVSETLDLARRYLQDAECYTRAISQRRLRMACALPLLIGGETLDLIEECPDAAKVKIPRSRVWLLLWKSAFFGR